MAKKVCHVIVATSKHEGTLDLASRSIQVLHTSIELAHFRCASDYSKMLQLLQSQDRRKMPRRLYPRHYSCVNRKAYDGTSVLDCSHIAEPMNLSSASLTSRYNVPEQICVLPSSFNNIFNATFAVTNAEVANQVTVLYTNDYKYTTHGVCCS